MGFTLSNCTRSSLDVLNRQWKCRREGVSWCEVSLLPSPLSVSLHHHPRPPPTLVCGGGFFKQNKLESVTVSLEGTTSVFLSCWWFCTTSSWWGCPVGSLMLRENSACPMLWCGAGGLSLGQVWGVAVVDLVPAARCAALVWDAKHASLGNWDHLGSLDILDLLLRIPLQGTMRRDVGQAWMELWGEHGFRNTFGSSRVALNLSDFLQGKRTKKEQGLWWEKCVVQLLGSWCFSKCQVWGGFIGDAY